MFTSLRISLLALALAASAISATAATSLNYTVTWVGNSFSGASNKWVQNFPIHTQVQLDGTVDTCRHFMTCVVPAPVGIYFYHHGL